MIELEIVKERKEGGATGFRLVPEHISLGSMGANLVDQIRVTLPVEWQNKTVRLTFIPEDAAKEKKALILDGAQAAVTGDISGSCAAGTILADAVDEAGYAAYTACGFYTAEEHPDAGGKTADYTPDEYQQFVSQIKAAADTAVEAKNKTAKMASAVQQIAKKSGYMTFFVDESGQLVELATTDGEDGAQTEKIPLGPVSDYAIAVSNGFAGTKAEWLASLKGADGKDGTNGADGAAAVIEIGTVTTAAAGEKAKVINRGTAAHAVLDFTLPAGKDGRQGISVTDCAFDARGHLQITLHNYADGTDTAVDAGAADTAALTQQIQDSVTEARNCVGRCQEISQLAKGYFAAEADLKAAYPDAEGKIGWWAIVGTTDTVWVWDDASVAWKDSGKEIDLSDYYTREQADAAVAAEADRAAAAEKSTGEQILALQQAAAVVDVKAQITVAPGTNCSAASVYYAYRVGRMLFISLSLSWNSSIPVGGDVAAAITFPADAAPLTNIRSTARDGKTAFMGSIDANGTVDLRVTANATAAASSTSIAGVMLLK